MGSYNWVFLKEFKPPSFPGVVELEMYSPTETIHRCSIEVHAPSWIFHSETGCAILVIEQRRRGGTGGNSDGSGAHPDADRDTDSLEEP